MPDTGKDPLPGCDAEEWLGANLKKGVALFAFCRRSRVCTRQRMRAEMFCRKPRQVANARISAA